MGLLLKSIQKLQKAMALTVNGANYLVHVTLLLYEMGGI